MRTVLVVGVGAGDPEQVTLAAVAALNRADAIVVVDRREELADLAAVRDTICRRCITGPYRELHLPDTERGHGGAEVRAWRHRRATALGELLAGLDEDAVAAILVWGDPAFYDGTVAMLEATAALLPLALEIVPGISSPQVLAARHRITLTRVGRTLTITPGRRLAEVLTTTPGDVVVMLDPACAFLAFPDHDIFWGAYLGMPDELLVAGRVAEVGARIRDARAAARARKGWMFDTYLLRPPAATG
jgi:precorrin-6A synthase